MLMIPRWGVSFCLWYAALHLMLLILSLICVVREVTRLIFRQIKNKIVIVNRVLVHSPYS